MLKLSKLASSIVNPRSVASFSTMNPSRIITRSAIFTEHGNPSDVIKVKEVDLGDLPSNKVALKMLISPINPSDKNQVQGVYPIKKVKSVLTIVDSKTNSRTETECYVGGNESIAEVVEIGPDAGESGNGKVNVGDWVIPMSTGDVGTWTTDAFADPSSLVVVRNREGLTPEQVGSVRVNASTAYRMLKDIVSLNKGDYVIQNGANSGVGQVLIQLAKLWGYRTINVVRDRDDFEEMEKFLKGLGADIIIKEDQLNSDETKAMMKALDAPVRLGINCIGGKPSVLMTKYMANGSYFATYGAMSKLPTSIPASTFIFKDIRFVGYWVSRWYKLNPVEKWVEMWDELFDYMRQGKLQYQVMEPVDWVTRNPGKDGSTASVTPVDIEALEARVAASMDSGKKQYFRYY
ncbi:hypothetical protein BB558_005806 [Smittium angustum]|uniref:Alcohol dehydrogenase-like C-terminal domain-containing protein n=1 Tax=Smittium angustum TaxID=133377 RepID=A0A2U1IZE7_SMIAN|nr:hypothetical protein BB558_005806 [Smittium angustum]